MGLEVFVACLLQRHASFMAAEQYAFERVAAGIGPAPSSVGCSAILQAVQQLLSGSRILKAGWGTGVSGLS